MLQFVSIQNFLVIERLEIEFDDKLNIITGETGSGKSIIIDALKSLFGDRVYKDCFRDSEKPIIIEAYFTNVDKISPVLKETFDIEGDLIIRREINYNSKNRIFINNRYATINDVREITRDLIEIAGQYENQKLLNKNYHIQYIDSMLDANYVKNYEKIYDKYLAVNAEYLQLKKEKDLFEKERDLLLFQKNELESANLKIDEDITIDDKIRKLSNREQLKRDILTSLDGLKYGDKNITLLTGLVLKSIEKLKGTFNELSKDYELLVEWSIFCSELSDKLEKILNGIDNYDENLDQLLERKYFLGQLCNKYKKNIKALIEFQKEISQSIETYYLKENQIKSLESELRHIKKELVSSAEKLSEMRVKAGKILEEKIAKIFEDVGLEGAQFKVIFHKLSECTSRGMDDVEFYISTNPGFESSSINKVASGGELSRIMLALKEVFSDVEGIGTIIFDEIDEGISGYIAKKIAHKLDRLSHDKQLIVITHLPVIAAAGLTHYHLIKREVNGKALTEVIKLSGKEREEVLATMIAGNVTESSIYQAKELLGTNK
jgi:DNA repair protein RecN (Recombination protein N)